MIFIWDAWLFTKLYFWIGAFSIISHFQHGKTRHLMLVADLCAVMFCCVYDVKKSVPICRSPPPLLIDQVISRSIAS